MITYEQFCDILNSTLFGEDKEDIFKKLASNPERFVGLFRPTKPKSKIFQNLLQSHEIRFGDAIEKVFDPIIEQEGFKHIEKRIIKPNADGTDQVLNIDLFFENTDTIYLVEQKVRDDHDSTKKRGQVDNFESKIIQVQIDNQEKKIIAIMFFVDSGQKKNKNYYVDRLNAISRDYGVETHLFYGEPFFKFLDANSTIWQHIIDYLTRWKTTLSDFPVVDMDNDPIDTKERLIIIEPLFWRKFLNNSDLWEQGIVQVIFPTGSSLKLLKEEFEAGASTIAKSLALKIEEKLHQFYPSSS